MKKLLTLVLAGGMIAFYACGPSKEELAKKDKMKQDSIHMADSMANAAAAAKAKAAADSTAKAAEAAAAAAKQKAMEDSIAMAKDKGKAKPKEKPKAKEGAPKVGMKKPGAK